MNVKQKQKNNAESSAVVKNPDLNAKNNDNCTNSNYNTTRDQNEYRSK
jgi:hypothetical protein